MSRYLEVFAEISEILESEDYEPERFQEMCYELAKELDVVREVVHACAAGPWRYDVENAPFDTQLLCWQETPDGCDWHCIGMKRTEQDEWECGLPGCVHDAPIAFAIINPPETPNHA